MCFATSGLDSTGVYLDSTGVHPNSTGVHVNSPGVYLEQSKNKIIGTRNQEFNTMRFGVHTY